MPALGSLLLQKGKISACPVPRETIWETSPKWKTFHVKQSERAARNGHSFRMELRTKLSTRAQLSSKNHRSFPPISPLAARLPLAAHYPSKLFLCNRLPGFRPGPSRKLSTALLSSPQRKLVHRTAPAFTLDSHGEDSRHRQPKGRSRQNHHCHQPGCLPRSGGPQGPSGGLRPPGKRLLRPRFSAGRQPPLHLRRADGRLPRPSR